MVEVTVTQQGMGEVAGFVQDFNALLNSPVALSRILGAVVRDNIKADIEAGGSPAGAFKRTDPKYVELEKKGDDRPLIWKGRFGKGIRYEITGEGVEVGSPAPYAPRLLHGGKNRNTRKGWPKFTNVWARPYLGVYQRDLVEFIARLKLKIATRRAA